MRGRMLGNEEGPMIACFSTCEQSIRTVPTQQHDPDRLEDIDTDGEDHAADDWRYACMSRPWIRESAKKPEPVFRDIRNTPLNELWGKSKERTRIA